MSVVARRVIATPGRSATEAWQLIVDLVAAKPSPARDELLGLEGIASSVIASKSMESAPLVVYGNGPRVRIYCLYDDDAIEGEQSNEQTLASSPTEGNWSLSLPVDIEDLAWIQAALKKRSTHVTARDKADNDLAQDSRTEGSQKSSGVVIDPEAFFRP